MASHVDPVCGLPVEDKDSAGLAEYEGTIYYFDREECISAFNEHPERYVVHSDKEKAGDARK